MSDQLVQPTAPIPVTEALPLVSMRVYIAGPYTVPNPAKNVDIAMEAYLQLMRKGHSPFCPHLSHYPDMMAKRIGRPVTYEQWLDLDLVWLAQCDCLLRLPGASNGADIECAEADRLHIPIYTNMADIPNVTATEQFTSQPWTTPRNTVPLRTHCKTCGEELDEKIRKPRALESPCPDCQSFDLNVCPDDGEKLFHPGCGSALQDLGYDRLCIKCARTFTWGDPRTYGRKPKQRTSNRKA